MVLGEGVVQKQEAPTHRLMVDDIGPIADVDLPMIISLSSLVSGCQILLSTELFENSFGQRCTWVHPFSVKRDC